MAANLEPSGENAPTDPSIAASEDWIRTMRTASSTVGTGGARQSLTSGSPTCRFAGARAGPDASISQVIADQHTQITSTRFSNMSMVTLSPFGCGAGLIARGTLSLANVGPTFNLQSTKATMRCRVVLDQPTMSLSN